jgi:lipopolysaccharide biosynthesis glycosyltransferase
LPPDVKRVLYLDADIAVVGPLDELYSIDLDGHCMAARVDGSRYLEDLETRLTGIDFKERYFNAGVMMIDLDRWRSEQVSEMVFEYCKEGGLPANDQTALNVVIRGRYVRIGPEWNFFRNSDVETCPPPKIIHFLFDKPWLRKDSVNLDIYQFHRGFTPWPFKPPSKSRFSWIRRHRHKLGARFGNKRMQESVEQFRLQSLVREKVINPAVTAARLAVIGSHHAETMSAAPHQIKIFP